MKCYRKPWNLTAFGCQHDYDSLMYHRCLLHSSYAMRHSAAATSDGLFKFILKKSIKSPHTVTQCDNSDNARECVYVGGYFVCADAPAEQMKSLDD